MWNKINRVVNNILGPSKPNTHNEAKDRGESTEIQLIRAQVDPMEFDEKKMILYSSSTSAADGVRRPADNSINPKELAAWINESTFPPPMFSLMMHSSVVNK
jgi:hypothetical protein